MGTDKVAYWLDIADYDLDTAEAMHQTGRPVIFVNCSGSQPEDPPYTHNHMRLAVDSMGR